MVTIRNQLVASTKNVSTNPNSRRTITVHETGNRSRGAGAQAHADLQSRPNPRVASWHYQVDDTGAIRSFPHQVRTFHAGVALGNRESISVEVCVNVGQDQRRAYLNAAELVAWIARTESLPLAQVVQHHYYSAKDCPDGLRNVPPLYGMSWSEFMAHVAAAYSGTTTTPTIPTTSKEDDMTPELAARLDQIVAWLDGRINQLAGFTRDNIKAAVTASTTTILESVETGTDKEAIEAAVRESVTDALAGVTIPATVTLGERLING